MADHTWFLKTFFVVPQEVSCFSIAVLRNQHFVDSMAVLRYHVKVYNGFQRLWLFIAQESNFCQSKKKNYRRVSRREQNKNNKLFKKICFISPVFSAISVASVAKSLSLRVIPAR